MTDKKDTEKEIFDRLKYTAEERFMIEIDQHLDKIQNLLKELDYGNRNGTQGPAGKLNNN